MEFLPCLRAHMQELHSQTWNSCIVSFRGAEALARCALWSCGDDVTEDSVKTKGPQHFEGVMYARS